MKKRLTNVAPLRAGIVLGILYGISGLVVALFSLLAGKQSGTGVVMAPVISAVAGFVGGIIVAALYNLVAKWTGGLEFEVIDETPVA